MAGETLCTIHIGLDDFDIGPYGCTTHAATFLLHGLNKYVPLRLVDYPNLVRLNPSIPWKTRGNGAVALRIEVPCTYVDKTLSLVDSLLIEYYERLAKVVAIDTYTTDKDPGVVVVVNSVPQVFQRLYLQTLTDVVLPDVVIDRLQRACGGVHISSVFRGRGIVGATAAIGWILHSSDYTYELLTYRQWHRYPEERCIDVESVKAFDALTFSTTFNNVDHESGRVLAVPHGRDPVLYGVRGDSVEDLKKALSTIKVCEPVAAWTVFRSNQGTDAHAIDRSVEDLRVYRTARLRLRISDKPVVLSGGHVIVKGSDATGSIEAVFFRPSGLARVAQNLDLGDEIIVQGHVKPWRGTPYLHVEKLAVVKLVKKYACKAPRCPRCGEKMDKKGFGKGYRCSVCGYKSFAPELVCTDIERPISSGLYVPPPSEQKHLIKPLKRYGRERHIHPYPMPMSVEDVGRITEPLGFL